jgi:PIN domain nuclease of toxin-antitoxin system
MDVALGRSWPPVLAAAPALILLDTNAMIWLHQRHRRARPLSAHVRRPYISPANLLELQFLIEADRIRVGPGTLAELATDPRWVLDDPPAAAWFTRALALGWTRDPFDRLLAAHTLYRGWRLATSDRELIERLGDDHTLGL